MRRLLLSLHCLAVPLWWRLLPFLLVLAVGCSVEDTTKNCSKACATVGMLVSQAGWIGGSEVCLCGVGVPVYLPDAGVRP